MRVRRIIVGILWASPILAGFFLFDHNGWGLFGVWAVAAFVFYYPIFQVNCPWFGPVVTRFHTTQREVWLTIDDGPDPQDTPQILAILARHQARATFFLIGNRAQRHPELVQEILRQGHTLGNHTFTHPVATFWMAFPRRLAREIDGCSGVLSTASPMTPPLFFRAPLGMTNLFVTPLLEQRGLHLIGWSARGFDALRIDVEGIVSRLWRDVRPGAILLLHEGNHPKNGASINPPSLALLLERLSSAGYACVLPEPRTFY